MRRALTRATWALLAWTSAMAGAGCRESDASGSAPRDAEPARSAPSVLVDPNVGGPSWTVGDAPVKLQSAIAVGVEGQKAWRLTVSTADLDCPPADATFPGPACPLGQRCLDAWFAPMLDAAGATSWEFKSAYVARGQELRRPGRVRGELFRAIREDEREVVAEGLVLSLADDETMSLEGDVSAKRCPRMKRPESRDVGGKALTVDVARTSFGVRGAVVLARDGLAIVRLATAPMGCLTTSLEGYDAVIDLAFEGAPPKLKLASLGGDRFSGDAAGSEGKADFVATFDGPLTGGEGLVSGKLAGKLDVQGFAVHVEGELTAERCPSLR